MTGHQIITTIRTKEVYYAIPVQVSSHPHIITMDTPSRASCPESQRTLQSHTNRVHPPTTPQTLFNQFKRAITTATGPSASFQVDSVPAEIGFLVARSLCYDSEIERIFPRITYNSLVERLSYFMPTQVHNAVAAWAGQEQIRAAASGFFTLAESEEIMFDVGSRVNSFAPPWSMTWKEPDGAFYAQGANLPSVILETGYPETWPKLKEDKDLWLRGGNQFVNAVLLVKWNKRSGNKVAGYLELHRTNGQQSSPVQIFPVVSGNANNVAFYRQDFYPAGALPAGRNGTDMWYWDVDLLRKYSREAMAREGLVPA